LQEIIELGRDGQERLLKRLTDHALGKMRRLTWRGAYVVRGGSVPAGHEPHDFANDAIAKVLDSDGSWNKEVYGTLENYLCSIIDSAISGHVNRHENRRERRLAPAGRSIEPTNAYEIPGTEADPLTIVIDEDWQARFHEAALKELAGDEFLVKLLECMESEITKPQEIAEVLDSTVEHVNNEKKRLRRKLDKLCLRVKPAKKGKR